MPTGSGRTTVHRPTCTDRSKGSKCGCPERMSQGAVRGLASSVRTRLHELGCGGEWSNVTASGNPANSALVRKYLTAITEWNLYEYPHGIPFGSVAFLHVFEFGPHVNPGPGGPVHSSYLRQYIFCNSLIHTHARTHTMHMHICFIYYILLYYIYRGSPCLKTKCENYHAANVSGLVTERTESLNSGL